MGKNKPNVDLTSNLDLYQCMEVCILTAKCSFRQNFQAKRGKVYRVIIKEILDL